MLLRMSFSGGILIIMIAAVRFLSANRLPKKYFMMLWGVALLRFRFGITVPVENAVADKVERMILSGDSLQKIAAAQDVTPEGAELSGILMRALPCVWAAAALLLSVILAVLYIRESRRMNEAVPLSGEQACGIRKAADIPERVRLLASDRIATPVVFGIVRPKIILPSFLLSEKSGRLKFVLAHEAAHVRRGDNASTGSTRLCGSCMSCFPGTWSCPVMKEYFPVSGRGQRESMPERWSVWRRNSIGVRFSPRDSGKALLKKGLRQL